MLAGEFGPRRGNYTDETESDSESERSKHTENTDWPTEVFVRIDRLWTPISFYDASSSEGEEELQVVSPPSKSSDDMPKPSTSVAGSSSDVLPKL